MIIIDYGVGNLGSLTNMFEYIGVESHVSFNPDIILQADRILLPGVGAFDHAMKQLRKSGLIPVLEEIVFNRKIPILGICLGMQIMAKSSEEGQEAGLGWIDAVCQKINTSFDNKLKIPNNGWQIVKPTRENILFPVASDLQRFYFNHSYHLVCNNQTNVAAEIKYGKTLCCAVEQDNIYGVQFHPEKSHRFGIQMLSNFANSKRGN